MLNRIYTIGHSTRSLEELVALLAGQGVARLADIRRYPGSRRHPHFSRESLERSLSQISILYEHFEDLGGMRSPAKESRNAAWENEHFRGYADHMATPSFHAAVDRLLASEIATAIMCAEAMPWRCHRNLLSDELVRRGIEVLHILGASSVQRHALSPMAKIEPDRVTYPQPQETMFR